MVEGFQPGSFDLRAGHPPVYVACLILPRSPEESGGGQQSDAPPGIYHQQVRLAGHNDDYVSDFVENWFR